MPFRRSSTIVAWQRPTMPCLLAWYAAPERSPHRPDTDENWMIRARRLPEMMHQSEWRGAGARVSRPPPAWRAGGDLCVSARGLRLPVSPVPHREGDDPGDRAGDEPEHGADQIDVQLEPGQHRPDPDRAQHPADEPR